MPVLIVGNPIFFLKERNYPKNFHEFGKRTLISLIYLQPFALERSQQELSTITEHGALRSLRQQAFTALFKN
jgi:hypothetical protein